MTTRKDEEIKMFCGVIDISMDRDGNHYIFRYIGRKKDLDAPDLELEFDSDDEHYIDDLENALEEFIQELNRKNISVAGTGVSEMDLAIAQMRDYEIMLKADEHNLQYMLKNHPEKVAGTPENQKYMEELEAWRRQGMPFWQRLFSRKGSIRGGLLP